MGPLNGVGTVRLQGLFKSGWIQFASCNDYELLVARCRMLQVKCESVVPAGCSILGEVRPFRKLRLKLAGEWP